MPSELLKAINPATGEWLKDIPSTTIEEVHHIYESAQKGYKVWKEFSIKKRLTYLKKLRLVMTDELDEISRQVSSNTGKVVTEALIADVIPTVDGIFHLEKHAEEVLSRKKVKTPTLFKGKKSYIEFMPRGVVLIISPWNYPLNLSMIPMISALVGGNCVILKPSEVTPLVGEVIERLFKRAGFPEGVVQVAHGDKEIGAALTSGNPDYIFFTGSVRTGKIIGEIAAQKLIPTTLELGGKDPMIVFEDANIERAVKGATWGAFTNSGQVCMSTERLYVHESVYNQFIEQLQKEVTSITRGHTEDSDLGSMTFPAQVDIVKAHIQDALEKGAKLICGDPPEKWDQTMFLPLTVLANVTQEMKIIKEETFGPILPVMAFQSEEEVIKRCNDSEYGLNASVWSRDLSLAQRVASQLESGSVVINDVISSVANHYLPFGGVKSSGIGRYHGIEGLTSFCHQKSITVDKGNKKTELQWFPYKGKYPILLSLFKNYFRDNRNWGKVLKDYYKINKKH